MEDKEGEPPSVRDVFHIVTDTMQQWMRSIDLFALTFLQTWTILLGTMFVYEGSLQRYDFTLDIDLSTTVVILMIGDIFIAAWFALMLRWAINVDGGWLRFLLELPIWYPISCLSYSAFLFQLSAAYWAVEIMKDYGHHLKTGYLYFSKVYFTTLVIALALGLFVHVTIERPLMKLYDSNRRVPRSILADDKEGYTQAPTSADDEEAEEAEAPARTRPTVKPVKSKGRKASNK